MINAAILEKLGVSAGEAQRYGPSFERDLPTYDIDTPLRQAHFIAQVLHESGMCRYTEENLNYSTSALLNVFGKYFSDPHDALDYHRQPEKIGARVYANRMGNGDEESGEGYYYRGRGLIQLTGKANYKRFSQWSGHDVVSEPDRVASEFPVLSALFFWDTNGLNRYADLDDFEGLTRRVNGGLNGFVHRQQLLDKAKRLLGGGERYRVTASRLNLRSEARIANNIIEKLPRGSEVFYLGYAGNSWAQVKLVDGDTVGYVSTRYLQKIPCAG